MSKILIKYQTDIKKIAQIKITMFNKLLSLLLIKLKFLNFTVLNSWKVTKHVLVHPSINSPRQRAWEINRSFHLVSQLLLKLLDCRRVFQLPRLTIRGNRDFETFARVTFAGIEGSFSAVRKSPMETTRESTRQFLVHSYKCFAFGSNETYGHEFTISHSRASTRFLFIL